MMTKASSWPTRLRILRERAISAYSEQSHPQPHRDARRERGIDQQPERDRLLEAGGDDEAAQGNGAGKADGGTQQPGRKERAEYAVGRRAPEATAGQRKARDREARNLHKHGRLRMGVHGVTDIAR